MLHPSYTDLMKVVNSDADGSDTPVVNSRYSIVLATSKRARQIIAGETPLVESNGKKPLSVAIQELESGHVKIKSEEETEEMTQEPAVDAEESDTADLQDEKNEEL
ncbi:MAG: DNA-directed RNA polymerase subunit omega [Lachnospiraceae bacterium]|jgi:DNA-directed RNA polymerase subunit omega|nr:DNA-directed RNA polymerase subunit omega [Lachnospiraceae bacterium]